VLGHHIITVNFLVQKQTFQNNQQMKELSLKMLSQGFNGEQRVSHTNPRMTNSKQMLKYGDTNFFSL